MNQSLALNFSWFLVTQFFQTHKDIFLQAKILERLVLFDLWLKGLIILNNGFLLGNDICRE